MDSLYYIYIDCDDRSWMDYAMLYYAALAIINDAKPIDYSQSVRLQQLLILLIVVGVDD